MLLPMTTDYTTSVYYSLCYSIHYSLHYTTTSYSYSLVTNPYSLLPYTQLYTDSVQVLPKSAPAKHAGHVIDWTDYTTSYTHL